MALESYESISSEETLVDELKSAIEWFQVEEWKAANDIIKSLNETQLTSFIEKSFKNENNERLTYSQMRQNQFYPFMVQSAIDLLSDKLKDEKYNENGEVDNTNWKALDEWIKECGWIDNQYWPWTKKVVSIVQKILKISDDWCAWPQFFAKVCSKLTGKEITDFKVVWYDNNNKYQHNLDKDVAEGKLVQKEKAKEATETAEVKNNIDRIKEYYKKPWRTEKDIIAIKRDWKRIYYWMDKWSWAWAYYYTDTINENQNSLYWPFDKYWYANNNDVYNAMDVGWAFSAYDITYKQVLAVKNAFDRREDWTWPKNDSRFLTWADEYIPQKKKWTANNRKDLAKWCVKATKTDNKCMWDKFRARWADMTKLWLPENKITIKTWLTLRNVDKIEKVVS